MVLPSGRPIDAKPRSRRAVFNLDSGEFADMPVYWRSDLTLGTSIKGPAVIAEDETSTIVSPNFDPRIDRLGYIELICR
jgi:N-methylhydantoinase A